MIKNISVLFIGLLSLCGCKKQAQSAYSTADDPVSTPWSISNNVNGHRLTITSSAEYAGAIYSLNWNDVEFINSGDHGRELQSAAVFDGLGECFNPTEAGSAYDGDGTATTSKLLSFSTDSNVLKSRTQMAFWTSVGQPYPAGCGMTNLTVAQNTTALSNHILSKQVAIGIPGVPNVIDYQVTFHVAEHHTSAIFESLTGYLTQNFTAFWTFDPATKTLATLSYGPGEQDKPIIFSTADKNYAMGIYTPGLPVAAFPGVGYGRYSYLTQYTTKWSAFYHMGDTPIGDYKFHLYVFVGTLAEVESGMGAVYGVVH